VSILTFIENAADSEIKGVEGDVTWLATQNLTLFGAFSYNDTELTNVFGQAVELVDEGSELPLTPKWQFSARGVYQFPQINGYEPYAQVQARYADDSWNSLVAVDRRKQDAYTIFDASVGVRRDNWRAELMVQNVGDESAELFINRQDDIQRITTNRPRTVSLRVSYDFSGS
jgi:outer membrane receptor protein involved in Fe transport